LMEFIPFFVVGALLFVALYLVATRPQHTVPPSQFLVDTRQAVSSLEASLLPVEVVGRIFDRTDRDYIIQRCPPEVGALFLGERRRVALLWVDHLRARILTLRRFHSSLARHHSNLSWKAELRVGTDFALLLLACQVLKVVIRLAGPFAAPEFVGSTVATAWRLCNASRKSLAFMAPALVPLGGSRAGTAPSR
jgi:hypothetical protein